MRVHGSFCKTLSNMLYGGEHYGGAHDYRDQNNGRIVRREASFANLDSRVLFLSHRGSAIRGFAENEGRKKATLKGSMTGNGGRERPY